jgi:prepilin-type N-terminal cleavage/methylation domain-containing protein
MIEHYRKIQRERAAGERDDSGFTLIELLIVIVVLGILAAVVVFALGSVTGKSAVAACQSDAKTVETAVAAFQANNPTLTPTAANLTSSATAGGPYLRSWPTNPTHYFIGLNQTDQTPATTTEVDVYPAAGTTPTTVAVSGTQGQPAANATATTGNWTNFDSETSSTTSSAGGCNDVS